MLGEFNGVTTLKGFRDVEGPGDGCKTDWGIMQVSLAVVSIYMEGYAMSAE
jgi:hypothetical protein